MAAPVLKGAADGCDHEMGAWTSSQLNHVITGNPDLSGLVFGIIFAIIQIPVVVAFGAFVMALALLVVVELSLWFVLSHTEAGRSIYGLLKV